MSAEAVAGGGDGGSRAFYTLADSSYFLGLAGLVNSLRLLGHREPIYALDCGLTDAQRTLLEREVTLVPAPRGLHPSVARAHAALLHPAREMILLDSDVIVTRPMTTLFEQAAAGVIVTFADAVATRCDPRWPQLLGLPEQHRHTYVNGGLFALSHASLPLLEELDRLSRQLDVSGSIFGLGSSRDAFYYLDQDVLNALLGARLRRAGYVVNDHRLAPHPPFRGLRLLDSALLRCTYADGVEPFVLHHVLRKPWLGHVRASIYSRLLTRLLLEPDVAVTPPPEWVPLRLRPGAAGSAARTESAVRSRISENRGRIGIRRRLARRPARRTDEVSPQGAVAPGLPGRGDV